jgi:hypothetical protein
MFFIENPFKSKLRIILEFEHALGIVGKLSMSGFNAGDLKNFRPKVHKILNFEYFFVIANSIKLQKMILEGQIIWVNSLYQDLTVDVINDVMDDDKASILSLGCNES